MSEEKKPGGIGRAATSGSFKAGSKGGAGRPKLTQKEKSVREALRVKIADVAYLLTIPKEEAVEILNRTDGTLLHNVLAKAIRDNDNEIIKYFILRMLGLPKRIIEQTTHDGDAVDLSKLSDKELDQYLKLTEKVATSTDR